MNIEEFKSANPAYKDVPDDTLAEKIHAKFYKGKISLDDFKQKVLVPGYGEVVGKGLARGAAQVGALPNLIAGGLAARVGADEFADTQFQAYDEINERTKQHFTPVGKQSTGQKVAGGIAESVAPLLAAGGDPALYAGTHALNQAAENVKGGMSARNAVALAPIEAGGSYASFAAPITGVKQAVLSQGGIAAAEEGMKELYLQLGNDDPVAKKQAEEVLKDFLPNVAVSALVGLGGATLVKLIDSVPAAKEKLKEKLTKKETPEQPSQPKQEPIVPKAEQSTAEHAFGAMPVMDMQKAEKAKREAKAAHQKTESEVWAGRQVEQTVAQPQSATPDGQARPIATEPIPVQPEAPKVDPMPVSEGVNRDAPLLFQNEVGEHEPLEVYFKGTGEYAKGKYAGARLHGLNSFDRAAMILAGKKGDSFASRTFTTEQIEDSFRRAGIDPAAAKEYGEKIIDEIKRQHEENVGFDGGHWNSPEGNLLPIFPHGRPQGMSAEHAMAQQSVEAIHDIVAKKEPHAEVINESKKLAEDLKEAKKQLKRSGATRNLFTEVKKAGGLHPSVAKMLGLDPKKFPGLFRESGKGFDDLQAWMRESSQGWINEAEAIHADDNLTGGARELAREMISTELHGVMSKGERAVHPSEIHLVGERVRLQEHVDNLEKLKNPVARGVAAVGLLAASEAAKADDGSETPTSNWLFYAAMVYGAGVAGRNVYKNPELRRKIVAGVFDAFNMFDKVTETGAKAITDQWDKYFKMAGRRIIQASHEINKVGTGTSVIELLSNPKFRANADYIAQLTQEAGWKEGDLNGVSIGAALEHWDERDPKTKEWIDAYFEAKKDVASKEDKEVLLNEYPMFRYQTGANGIIEGVRQGMKLKGSNAGEGFVNYAASAFNKVSLGKQIQDLKKLMLRSGKPAMSQIDAAYIPIGEAWGGTLTDLEGWMIHPDLKNDFMLSFNTYRPGDLGRAIQAINLLVKRSEVGLSGFHAMSLAQAKVNDVVGRALTGEMPDMDGAHAMMAEARRIFENPDNSIRSKILDDALGEGLMLGGPLEAVRGKEEVYHVLDATSKLLEHSGIGLNKAPKAIKRVDQEIQKFTWDYVQTNFKIMTVLKEVETQMAKHPERDYHEIVKNATEYTNDLFGSLDWRRIAYQFNSKIGRMVTSELFSGKGQFWMNMTLFAPDWLLSTSRAWLQALPRLKDGSIVWDDKNKLYARYLLGGMMAYVAAGEAMNYYFTGHDMLDNKPNKKNPKLVDKVKAVMQVDRGDGTSIQLSKHFTDFINLMLDMGYESDNKESSLFSTIEALRHNKPYEQSPYPITYSEAPLYTSPNAAVDVGKFLGKKAVPISAQALFGDGTTEDKLARMGYGFVGMPLRGATVTERADMKAEEKAKKGAESGH